jgi:hypothetical protein
MGLITTVLGCMSKSLRRFVGTWPLGDGVRASADPWMHRLGASMVGEAS